MIGLDTNVLIRYIVQDDLAQSAVANRVFESELSATNKGYVCPIVLCEVVWVLARAYKQKKAKLREVVRMLLLADFIEIGNRDAAWKALRDFEAGNADFSDYLIAAVNREEGANVTLTFDRCAASENRLFRLAE